MIPNRLIDYHLSEYIHKQVDVIIIGSGIAGLFAAILASEYKHVLMITKKSLLESNTRYAQGGIAAVISTDDSPLYHRQDTLLAGAGLCSSSAVDVLVQEGPAGVQELIRLGTLFDTIDGQLELTREGAHSHRRILHANGDSTGYEIVRALSQHVAEHPRIEVWDEHFAIDFITEHNECKGVIVKQPNGSLIYVQAEATVICSGGSGQLYQYTTNPDVATGDGVAMAYRAGAQVRDMEFIQFHPTALCYPGAPRFLISEALRGEGAILRNRKGEAFMKNYHPLLELAPRDIVARAIISEMEKEDSAFVYLDITHEREEVLKHRFPTIYETCMSYGLQLAQDWIPVAPAAHYMMGGIKTDLQGATSVQRLFACGEVSSTGIHGANRLASNSLSEAIVFGKRVVQQILQLNPIDISNTDCVFPKTNLFYDKNVPEFTNSTEQWISWRLELQGIMGQHAGLRRTASSLQEGIDKLEALAVIFEYPLNTREALELANMLTCALLVMRSALYREESRGGHYREDFPERNDDQWQQHILQQIDQELTKESSDDV